MASISENGPPPYSKLNDLDVYHAQNNVTSYVNLLNLLRKIWAPRRRACIFSVEQRAGLGGVKVHCLHWTLEFRHPFLDL